QKLLSIIPRANSSPLLLKRARVLAAGYEHVRIISVQPHQKERAVAARLAHFLKTHSSLRAVHTLEDLVHALEGSTYVLSERYHGALAAIALGIPVEIIHQRPGDKLSALQKMASEDRERSSTERYLRELIRNGEETLRTSLLVRSIHLH
ncbi:MAG: hypothetical protein RIQ56_558, partial [Candidatus Parcubacteria bacterium]